MSTMSAEDFAALLQQETADIAAPLIEEQRTLVKKQIAIVVVAIVVVGIMIWIVWK